MGQTHRWRINSPSLNGVGLAPCFTSRSTNLSWQTEEISQSHAVGSGGWWCNSRSFASWLLFCALALSAGGDVCSTYLSSEFLPHASDHLLLTSILSQLLTMTICIALNFHFSECAGVWFFLPCHLPAHKHDRSLQVTDFTLDAIVIRSSWSQHLF